jgi:hypothetical protein
VSDYDMPSAFWESKPRARKIHECDECRNKIEKGEHYRRVSGVWSGEFSHYKICNGCETLRGLVHKLGVETFLGGLYECMEEAEQQLPVMEVLGAMAR